MKRIWNLLSNKHNPKAIQFEDLRFVSRDDIKLDQFLNLYRNSEDIKLLTKPIGNHHTLSFYDNVIYNLFVSCIEDVRENLPITSSKSEVNKYSFLFYRVSDCLKENLNPREYVSKCYYAVYRMRNFLLNSKDKASISKYLPTVTYIEFEEIIHKILTMSKNVREYDSTTRTYDVVDKNTSKKYIARPCFENVSTDSIASRDCERSSSSVIAFESTQEGEIAYTRQDITSFPVEDDPTEETPLIGIERFGSEGGT